MRAIGVRRLTRDEQLAAVVPPELNAAIYLSTRDLANRWRVSKSSATRIADRAGFRRIYLGYGKHGVVRYLKAEVLAFEVTKVSV